MRPQPRSLARKAPAHRTLIGACQSLHCSLLSRAPTRSTRRKGREKRRTSRNDSNFLGRANERGRQAAAAARARKAALFRPASAKLLCKVQYIAAAPGPFIAPLPSLLLHRSRARVASYHFFDGKCEMTQTRSRQRRPKSGCQARPSVRRRASRPARRRQTFAASRATSLLDPAVLASPSRELREITIRYARSTGEKGSGGQGEQKTRAAIRNPEFEYGGPAIDDEQQKKKCRAKIGTLPPSPFVGGARLGVVSARARGEEGGTNERNPEKRLTWKDGGRFLRGGS